MAGKGTSNISVYIDGACRRNGKIGARATYGIYVETDGTKLKGMIDRSEKQTNNTGELTAAIEALNYAALKNISEIIIKSDSEYVIRGITKDILFWRENNWKLKSTNAAVKNKELWERLYERSSQMNVKWVHVRRDTEEGQIIADKLAKEAYEQASVETTENNTESQSRGQHITQGEVEPEDREQAVSLNPDGINRPKKQTGGKIRYGDANEDFDEDETFVKYIINQNQCIMCENGCNDFMVQCQICYGRVHYTCSLLPVYFLCY